MEEITQILQRLCDFENAVPHRRYPNHPIVSIEQGDSGKAYIKIHPSLIFPYEAILDMSLCDGKPHVEIVSGEDGASHLLLDEENGAPLRINMDDGDAYEDDAEWPKLADWRTPQAQQDKLYRNPGRATLVKLWDARKGLIQLHVWFKNGDRIEHILPSGFGSQMCGHLDNDEFIENLDLGNIVAAGLYEMPEWKRIEDCTSCGRALFQHFRTRKITDEADSIRCVDITALGPYAGTLHTTNPSAKRIVK